MLQNLRKIWGDFSLRVDPLGHPDIALFKGGHGKFMPGFTAWKITTKSDTKETGEFSKKGGDGQGV